MEKRYLNEKHRQYSEACQREVRKMMKHPLPREEKEQQMRRNRAVSWARKNAPENRIGETATECHQ